MCMEVIVKPCVLTTLMAAMMYEGTVNVGREWSIAIIKMLSCTVT